MGSWNIFRTCHDDNWPLSQIAFYKSPSKITLSRLIFCKLAFFIQKKFKKSYEID